MEASQNIFPGTLIPNLLIGFYTVQFLQFLLKARFWPCRQGSVDKPSPKRPPQGVNQDPRSLHALKLPIVFRWKRRQGDVCLPLSSHSQGLGARLQAGAIGAAPSARLKQSSRSCLGICVAPSIYLRPDCSGRGSSRIESYELWQLLLLCTSVFALPRH